jgi:hypothetical protein
MRAAIFRGAFAIQVEQIPDATFRTISAYVEDWHRLGRIFPNSLKTCLPVDSTPRQSWISRSALPRLLQAIVRWISDRPSKPWFDRNKKRSSVPQRERKDV